MRLNSIGVKLVVTAAALLVAEAGARSYFEAAADAREFREDFTKNGFFHAASVAQAAEYGFLARDTKELLHAADLLRSPEDADLLYVAFYDENGDLLTSRRYGKAADEVPARMAVVAAAGARPCAAPGGSDCEHYLFCVPVAVSRAVMGAAGEGSSGGAAGNETAMVVAARSYAGVRERVAAAQRETALVSTAVFAALMLALLVLARRIVKPIRRLAKATERVAGGDLETRVDVGRRRDEFGVLADRFNRMTGQLREQRGQILSHSRDLERKVAERTEALTGANEELHREAAKLSAMISGMDEGVVFADADGVIVEVNEFFCRFVQKPREAILGARLEACHSGATLEGLRARVEQFRANPGSEPFVIQRPLGPAEVMLRMQPIYRDGRYDGVLLNVVDVTELVRARQAAEAANARLEELATTDELTGLSNRRRFFELLKQEFQRVRRHGVPLALAMFDLDHFKSVNDTYGHAFGDRVLVEVARAILGEVRETDVAVRYGGEEFIVLMPNTSSEEAVSAVERIRKRVAQRYISDGKHSIQVALSAGVSAAEASGTNTPEALLRLADEALYAAKHAGRDCVRTWQQIRADQVEEVVSQSKQVDDLQRRMARLSLRSKDAFVRESQGLVQALEARDPYMKSHSVNVTRYAVAIAETLGLDPEETARIRRAAVLHDIGKIGVPDAILRKPGPLTAEERRIMEDHVLLGVRMLEQLNFLDREVALVRHHHERWDGRGYPDGVLGEAIPRGARVLAVADALDAVVSDRVYRGGGTVMEAIRTLQDEAGRQFDPAVVDALVRWVVEVGRGLGAQDEVTCEDLMRSQETTPTPLWLASPDRV